MHSVNYDIKCFNNVTRAGSEYRDRISMTILEMQESGRIQVLYNKWWKNTGVCVSDDKKKESKASSLGVANVGGIFVVLFVGLALAVIVAALEFVWNNRRQTSVNRLNKQVFKELSPLTHYSGRPADDFFYF